MSRFVVIYFGILCLLGDCVLSAPPLTANDVCDDPRDNSSCQKQSVVQYYFNKEKDICETFTYQGCSSSRNHFNTMEECQRTCMIAAFLTW